MAEEKVKQKTTAEKSTETAKEAYKVVKRMYLRAQEAREQGAPVAWVMVGCIAEELLKAMDVVPIYTENYAAVCAAKKSADSFIASAEAEDFSKQICGYVRTGIGHAIQRKEHGAIPPDAPIGGMADPQMLIGCSFVCDPRYKWYQSLARYMDTPYLSFDVVHPSIDVDHRAVQDYYLEYQLEEIKRFVAFLESHTGKKLDLDKLEEAIDIAQKTRRVWWECYELRKAVPGPMPFEDMQSCVVPGMFDPADPESLAFYQRLRYELQHRVDNKIGVVPDERHRLLWAGGLPPWHSMGLFNYFEHQGAVVVMETAYYPGTPYEREPGDDPLTFLAKYKYHTKTEMYDGAKAPGGCGHPEAQRLLDWIDGYHIDGLVMHATTSCRANTIGQIFLKNIVQEHVKVPTLFLESDIIDERDYSEAQTHGKIDAFIETLASAKVR